MTTGPAASHMTLVLASASPRRRELLAGLGVEFTVAPADIDEQVRPGEPPLDYVRRMAIEKARAGYAQAAAQAGVTGLTVMGADTAVVLGTAILGKPVDRADGIRMLELLSGQAHQVLSSVALTDGQRLEERTSVTDVVFRPLRSGESAAYWETGEPHDKAGAYAIQGLGALFVEELSGSYSGVVGLPLFETAAMLLDFGCDTGLLGA
jgi:septum formation protein